jgi:hypothetical protein
VAFFALFPGAFDFIYAYSEALAIPLFKRLIHVSAVR